MEVCWVLLIVVGCRFAQSAYSCSDMRRSVCLPAGCRFHVPCPKLPGQDVKFTLMKNQDVIYNHTCSQDKNITRCSGPFHKKGVEMEQGGNNSISFLLTGITPSSHGVYRCEGVVMFPPPLLDPVPGPSEVLLLVDGHQCKAEKCPQAARTEKSEDRNKDFLWIWILLALLGAYSVVITILAAVFLVRLKNTDSQNEYMNTKPRAPPERRRNKGVQNPAPRFF